MKPLVICLIDRRNNHLSRKLSAGGFEVIESFAADQAVALSVGREVAAVVIDELRFAEREGWSVARSFKMLRPAMCVLLARRSIKKTPKPPPHVNAVVPLHRPVEIIETLRRMLLRAKSSTSSPSI